MGYQSEAELEERLIQKLETQGLDKMTDELHSDIIKYLGVRSVTQIELMKKYEISRNTLKKYIEIVKNEK